MTSALTLGNLTLPGQIGRFTVIASSFHNHEKEQAGLGYSVQYAGDRDSLTAYVYTLGIDNLPNTTDSKQFVEQMQQCVEGIARSMTWTDLNIVDQGKAGVPNCSNSLEYVVLQGTPTDQARPIHNIVWLGVVNHNFVKVRCTTRASNLTSALVKNVARGLLLHFEPPTASPGGGDAFNTPLRQTVRRLVSRESGMGESSIDAGMKIREDLAIVDVELFTLTMALEEEFAIEIADGVMDSITTVGDLVSAIEQITALQAKSPSPGPAQMADAANSAPIPKAKEGLFSRFFGRK